MLPLAAVSLAVWIYLLAFRGGFWRMRVEPAPPLAAAPAVAVIIPARNEAELIARAIHSLLDQDYPGPLHFFLVDDHSTDGTADVVHDDRVTVARASPLPADWTGKVWAMAEGVRHAAALQPAYLLFTDADIVHDPANVSALVARSQAGGYDMVSLMVRLRTRSTAEKLLVPAFVFFFFQLYPPDWVRRREHRTAAAAGGCMLVRTEALVRAGGLQAIRNELIDDCALARAVKRTGGLIWLGLADRTHSIRAYEGFGGVRRMIARSAYTQLRRSILLLGLTTVAMLVAYAVPLTPAGIPAWLVMTAAYTPVLRYYRLGIWRAFLLPVVAMFYLAATLESALLDWTGRGGQWKGRTTAR